MTEEEKTAPLFARIPLDLKSDVEDIALQRKRRGDRTTLAELTIEALRLLVERERQGRQDQGAEPIV